MQSVALHRLSNLMDALRLFPIPLLCQSHQRVDSNNVHDIFNAATAGQIKRGLLETLNDGSDSFRSAEALGNLVRDVSCVEVGEYEDIGLAGNRAARRFALTDSMVERASGRTVEGGSPSEVTELWTFRRARGGDWLLSAIQQT